MYHVSLPVCTCILSTVGSALVVQWNPYIWPMYHVSVAMNIIIHYKPTVVQVTGAIYNLESKLQDSRSSVYSTSATVA